MSDTSLPFSTRISCLLAGALAVGAINHAAAQTDYSVYTDSLQNGWQNWSWGSVIDFSSTSVVHSSPRAIAVTITNYWVTNTWGAIFLHHAALDSSSYTNLSFWINGGPAGGQKLQVAALLSSGAQPSVALAPLPADTWQQITIPLSALGVADKPDLTGFWIQESIASAQPTFYLDDIVFVAGTPPPTSNAPVNILVDAQRNRHAISPLIYGVAFASSNELAELNCPLNRSGGNAETRYNWLLNAHNRAADWYFESIGDSPATPGAAADDFIANSKNAGAQAMVTIPMIGWMPKLGPNRGKLASYSIAKYGPQTGNDWQWFPDAGNGIVANSTTPITWNDPNDANFPTNSAFQQAWVEHLTNTWGVSTNGGVRFYLMDNEWSIWHSTHQDIHPVGATMQEVRDKFFDYAGMVKSVDPSALILAPEEWGWSGYLYSGYDQQYGSQHGWSYFPDRGTNGGWDYLPWLLDQFHQRAASTGRRLLDYFTVHFYPQGGESGNDVSTTTQLLRNRSTRALWDTNYVDASWINSVVMLIPRLKEWVATYYPGTKIGITEYNWGAENHINGATAQADILGIFGREGLDLATRWTTPASTSPTFKAMKMYRNYDGHNLGFGDTSVFAGGPNPDNVSTFAAVRSKDGALTVMVVNKQLSNGAEVDLTITNFSSSGVAMLWQLTSANTINRLSDIIFSGSAFTNLVPAQSITLFVLPPAPAPARPRLRADQFSSSNTFNLWLDAEAGRRYVLQATADFFNWEPLQTNTLASNSVYFVLPAADTNAQFYRAQWVP